jgi:BMFP domain-containing protein YqiC
VDKNFLRDLADRLANSVPQGASTARADLARNFDALLRDAFARMDLVTREEFDIQRKVLERTRARLAELEVQLGRLEAERAADQDPAAR